MFMKAYSVTQFDDREMGWRKLTCNDVRRFEEAVNDVRLRMRVKQLLGNDANRLLFRFSDWRLNSRQTAWGGVSRGVLVMVSACS